LLDRWSVLPKAHSTSRSPTPSSDNSSVNPSARYVFPLPSRILDGFIYVPDSPLTLYSTRPLPCSSRRPHHQFQGMQMQFAQVATEIEAARLLTYNAARLKEEGQSFTKQAAMAKWYASVVAQKASGSAIEWAGGIGFTRGGDCLEKYWRDSKVSERFDASK
jgi:hypothetical protein